MPGVGFVFMCFVFFVVGLRAAMLHCCVALLCVLFAIQLFPSRVLFFFSALVLFSSFSFFLLVQKEREKEKGPPKTNAPHVLGLAMRCCYAEYALSVVSAIAHDGAMWLCACFFLFFSADGAIIC